MPNNVLETRNVTIVYVVHLVSH